MSNLPPTTLSPEELAQLLTQLESWRTTLAYTLDQVAKTGSAYALPGTLHTITESRVHIQHLKAALRANGIEVAEHPTDNPTTSHIYRDDIQLTEALGPSEYYHIAAIDELSTEILANSGYYLIESALSMGKTTFITQLWTILRRENIHCITIIFNKDRQRTSIEQAIFSIKNQISQLINSGIRNDNLSIIDSISRFFEIHRRLFILVDGLDESDENERKLLHNILIDLPIPTYSGQTKADITIIVTTRPNAFNHFMKDLPKNHTLRKGGYKKRDLPMFTKQDILNVLSDIEIQADKEQLATDILQGTSGFPGAVVRIFQYIKTEGLLPDPYQYQESMQEIWNSEISQIHETCNSLPDDESMLVRKMMALFAVSLSGLALSDIAHIIDIDLQSSLKLLGYLNRIIYSRTDEGYTPPPSSFRECVRQHQEYQVLLSEVKHTYAQWLDTMTQKGDSELDTVSRHALQHAAEYKADSIQLVDLLVRHAWWNQLRRGKLDVRVIHTSILHCWDSAARNSNNASTSIRAINIIGCALTHASFNKVLIPELILELVARRYWQPEEAREYAQRYISRVDRDTINTGLLDISNRSLVPPDFERAIEELDLAIGGYPSVPIQEILEQWTHDWSIKLNTLIALRDERDQATRLQSVLLKPQSPPSLGTREDTSRHLNALLTELQRYDITQDGHDRLSDLLSDISTAWSQRRSWQSVQLLSSILRPLIRYSRADLLYALELLAPALQRHFAFEILTGLNSTIQRIVTAYP